MGSTDVTDAYTIYVRHTDSHIVYGYRPDAPSRIRDPQGGFKYMPLSQGILYDGDSSVSYNHELEVYGEGRWINCTKASPPRLERYIVTVTVDPGAAKGEPLRIIKQALREHMPKVLSTISSFSVTSEASENS